MESNKNLTSSFNFNITKEGIKEKQDLAMSTVVKRSDSLNPDGVDAFNSDYGQSSCLERTYDYI